MIVRIRVVTAVVTVLTIATFLIGCVRIEFVGERSNDPQPVEVPAITLEGTAAETYDLSHDAALEEGTAGANTVLELVNRVRIQEGLEPLTINLQLNEAAQAQADHQASIGEMTHDGLGGLSERVSATGYQWRMLAENVAYGQTSYTQVMTGWVNSPGHYVNIVNPELEEMGFAVTYGNDGRPYFAQVFGSRLV